MTQKELKEKYMHIIKTEIWEDEHMQEYCKKKCEYVVELSNGNIIEIEKPRIQKDFCFGMGMYATYTDEELEKAEELADKARTDISHFMNENMKQIMDEINCLKECLNGNREAYTFIKYSGQPENSDLVEYKAVTLGYNPDFSPMRWDRLRAVRKLDKCDIEKIIAGLEEVLKKFEKRLNTYLKKYGLSKLNVWTYCRD